MAKFKIKTLKDIEFPTKQTVKISDMVDREELKQEVIKFIKAIERESAIGFYCTICEEFNCDCGSSDCFKLYSLEEVKKVLMFMYNIKKEDL